MTVGVFTYLVPIYGVGTREKKNSISMEFGIFYYGTPLLSARTGNLHDLHNLSPTFFTLPRLYCTYVITVFERQDFCLVCL